MFILICGQSRAGKTTYSKQFEQNFDVIHADNFFNQQRVLEKIKNRTDDIVLDGIFWKKETRKKLCQLYKGTNKICIYLDTPLEIREKRTHYNKIYNVPFQPPSYEEGWNKIKIIKEKNNNGN